MKAGGFEWRITAEDGHARCGVLKTRRGEVATPTFMPVGTQGAVKTLTPQEVAETGARIVLSNTYHLWLRPGVEVIAGQGGLPGFTRWPFLHLTDSGGFQAFSLSERRTWSEEGFTFRSHLDGSQHLLSPEQAMRAQGLLGSDIAMQLDVCPPGSASRAEVERAVAQTTRWAERCLAARHPDQAVFGIVQGGVHVDLRLRHAQELGALSFEGLALGGFSVGEPIEKMHEVVAAVAPNLDRQRPRYLMGVGTPQDLLNAIGTGIDMFDCVLPTRNARNGQAFTRRGRISIKQSRFRDDRSVLDKNCSCPCCRAGYPRAYLRHLFVAREILVLRLLTQHNLWLYGELMAQARCAVAENRYSRFAREWLDSLSTPDP
jgi:queuine tRNA-ribosyltransferase